MPQKKNPDIELVMGKTGRVYGALISLLTTEERPAFGIQTKTWRGQRTDLLTPWMEEYCIAPV